MTAEWLDAFGALLEARADAVAAAVGPEPFTMQETYTDAPGGGRDGWYVTFEGGAIVAFGRGQASSTPDTASVSPWPVARRLAATVVGSDLDRIAAYQAEATPHVQRSYNCDPERIAGLRTALGDLHDEIARRTAPDRS